MTQRKYKEDVSKRQYAFSLNGYDQTFRKSVYFNIPVRIIRESFYRQLIKCYEQMEFLGLKTK